MNIFVLSTNPYEAAKLQCDKHVVKMIVECWQMLSTAHHVLLWEWPLKITHKNHPCTIRARTSKENYNRLVEHMKWLLFEYTYRYKKTHKYQDLCKFFEENQPELPPIGLNKFAQAIPDEFKSSDVVKSYREFYLATKMHFAKWKYTSTPAFARV